MKAELDSALNSFMQEVDGKITIPSSQLVSFLGEVNLIILLESGQRLTSPQFAQCQSFIQTLWDTVGSYLQEDFLEALNDYVYQNGYLIQSNRVSNYTHYAMQFDLFKEGFKRYENRYDSVLFGLSNNFINETLVKPAVFQLDIEDGEGCELHAIWSYTGAKTDRSRSLIRLLLGTGIVTEQQLAQRVSSAINTRRQTYLPIKTGGLKLNIVRDHFTFLDVDNVQDMEATLKRHSFNRQGTDFTNEMANIALGFYLTIKTEKDHNKWLLSYLQSLSPRGYKEFIKQFFDQITKNHNEIGQVRNSISRNYELTTTELYKNTMTLISESLIEEGLNKGVITPMKSGYTSQDEVFEKSLAVCFHSLLKGEPNPKEYDDMYAMAEIFTPQFKFNLTTEYLDKQSEDEFSYLSNKQTQSLRSFIEAQYIHHEISTPEPQKQKTTTATAGAFIL